MDETPPPRPPAPDPAPATARDKRTEARLAKLIVTDDPIVAWAQGWVSRKTKLPGLLAARTLDFAVLTTNALGLVTTGFFTRRPRRCVYAARLSDLVESRRVVANGRRLRVTTDEGKTLWIELRATDRGRMFAAAIVAASGTDQG